MASSDSIGLSKTKVILYTVLAAVIVAISFLFDALAASASGAIRNNLFDIIFSLITNFGILFIVLIVIPSLFLWIKKKKEWIPALGASYATAILIVFVLKLIIARERPIVTEFYPIIHILEYSFPSMHAAAAFAAIPILDRVYPVLKKFWIIFAVLVAFSRIYFDKHYLSDVLAGSFIGFGIGMFFIWLEVKTKIFKKLMKMIGYG
ncbi:MAG: phosphatase PAP2 family protein [Nanoarchaeota archaeon]|nr:phosphatase PAP2 family protein [Nanoarchaeota archaeon]